jgi:hypothetical protein
VQRYPGSQEDKEHTGKGTFVKPVFQGVKDELTAAVGISIDMLARARVAGMVYDSLLPPVELVVDRERHSFLVAVVLVGSQAHAITFALEA